MTTFTPQAAHRQGFRDGAAGRQTNCSLAGHRDQCIGDAYLDGWELGCSRHADTPDNREAVARRIAVTN